MLTNPALQESVIQNGIRERSQRERRRHEWTRHSHLNMHFWEASSSPSFSTGISHLSNIFKNSSALIHTSWCFAITHIFQFAPEMTKKQKMMRWLLDQSWSIPTILKMTIVLWISTKTRNYSHHLNCPLSCIHRRLLDWAWKQSCCMRWMEKDGDVLCNLRLLYYLNHF